MYLTRYRKSKHEGSGLNRCYKNFSPLILLLGALFFIGISCSDDSPSGTDTDFSDVPGFEAEVGEETAVMPAHVSEASLIDYDQEDQIFRFDPEVLADADFTLEEGEVLFIEGQALRRISSVTESNGELVVETDFASLAEAFKNAEVEWTEELNFDETVAEKALLEVDGQLIEPVRTKNGTSEWEYEFGDFTVEGTLATDDNTAQISVLAKYELENVSGAMLATLTLEQLSKETGFQILDHEAERFEYRNSGLKGEMDMEFVFAGGRSGEVQIPPPFPAIVIPMVIGSPPLVIPVQFRIGTIIVGKVELGAQGSARYETSFTYDGDLGVQVEGSDFSPVVEGGIADPNQGGHEANAAGPSGTVSGQYGIAIPDFSLRMFGEGIVPYLRQEFYLGALYSFPTCTHVFSRYEINAGVNMEILGGRGSFSLSQNLAERTLRESKSDGCNGNKMLADYGVSPISVGDYHIFSNDNLKGVPYRITE